MEIEREALLSTGLMPVGTADRRRHGNMLAIAGSPGSGKTTLAVKLAAEIGAGRKNVIVVCSDPFVPSIPCLLPADKDEGASLGALLTEPGLSQEKILQACVPVSGSEHISLLGYQMGESLMSYPKVTRERAVELLVCLRHLADYVILDCTAVFEADVFSIAAMEQSDRLLRVGTSNLRGISYCRSHAGMLAGREYEEKLLSAIGNFKTGQEWEAAAGQYGGVSFVFPYVAELEKQYDEGGLWDAMSSREAGPFQTEIKKVLAEVFGLHEEKQTGKSTGGEKRKLAVRSPFIWKNKGEF